MFFFFLMGIFEIFGFLGIFANLQEETGALQRYLETETAVGLGILMHFAWTQLFLFV